MANLFDLANNVDAFNKLQAIKADLTKKEEDEERKYLEEKERKYRAAHIFHSYTEALDWLVENKGRYITWHCSNIVYDVDKQMFKAYEQEYSYDGVMCYDVINFYTKNELLKRIEDHTEWLSNEYPNDDNTNWYLDKYGTLEYVYIA